MISLAKLGILHPKTMLQSHNNSTLMEIFGKLASTLASFMVIWAMLSQFIPYELRRVLEMHLTNIYSRFRPYVMVTIPEYSGDRLKRSDAYISITAYLASLSTNTAKRLTAEIQSKGEKIVLSMDENERVEDVFQGVKVWWVLGKFTSSLSSRGKNPSSEQECKYYRVTFHHKHRELITMDYLKHVVVQGKEIRLRNKQRKLYTNALNVRSFLYGANMWSSMPFEHPATFDTVAMDAEKKKEIMDDLVKFSKSKEFYARTGKAWKRGYLLYGPPGTGKSTLIAAMSNLLKYDVFDLELTAVRDNTELRRLLIETTSKSIIVIEDIDCSLDLTGQRKKVKDTKVLENEGDVVKEKEKIERSKVTLSGLLNFIDGIWSSCGGERIIVFTTNYVEKLDPALIRRGRMDKHIEMSYCSFEGFKVLAKNYLFLKDDHVMLEEIKELLSKVKITPADVRENLMPMSLEDDANHCLKNLIRALVQAKEEHAKEEGSVL